MTPISRMRRTKAGKRPDTILSSEVTEEFQKLSYEWPDLKSVDVMMSFRQEGDEMPEAPMIHYYISSADLNAKKLAEAARQHWHIEAKFHWSLDVALRENACKIHRGQAAENLARVRHITLNYLKKKKSFKDGIRRKQKKAALDE